MKNYTVTVRVTETKSLFKKQVFEATFLKIQVLVLLAQAMMRQLIR